MFFGGVFVALLLVVVILGTTGLLVRNVWKGASLAGKLVASLILCATTYGALGTLTGVVKAVGAMDGMSVDPSQKARMLAEGISMVMNCTAFMLALWIPGIIAALVFAKRRNEAAPPR